MTGGSTYIVSLPKNWIDELKIKKNSDVTLIKNSNDSITLFQDEQNKKVSELHRLEKMIQKNPLEEKLLQCIISGYKIIEIRTKGMEIPSTHRSIIRDLVRTTLMGTEIIEASSEKMRLQVLTQLAQLSFNVALKRMYITAAGMHREAIEALQELDIDQAEEVIKMDDEVDRFSLYIMRNLNLALENVQILLDSGLKKASECLGYRIVVKCVERIADHAALVAKKIKYLESKIEKKTLTEIKDLSDESLTVFENSINAFSKKDYLIAEKVATDVSKVIEKEKKQMDRLKPTKNTAIIKLILEDIRRTAEYSRDISEVIMDETVQSVIKEE